MKNLTYAEDWLRLLFLNESWAAVSTGLGGTGTAGNLYVSLHTADPASGTTQDVNEASYTGYSRQAVPRSAAGWTVASNIVSNTATIAFGVCTAVPQTITHVGIGVGTGASLRLYSFPLISDWKNFHGENASTFIEVSDHGLAVDDRVQMVPDIASGLPGAYSAGVTYWVVGSATGQIALALTKSGSAIVASATGFGLLGKITPLVVDVDVEPVFVPGWLNVTEE